jgi:putative transposase
VLRRPVESAQYTSIDYTQTLGDHGLLASVGSVGDAYDNALAESFVDSFKTELIADRVRRTRSQLELAVVEYLGWFNTSRLHESLGDLPPVEFEQRYATLNAATGANPDDQSVTPLPPNAAERRTTPRFGAGPAAPAPNDADHGLPASIAVVAEPHSERQNRSRIDRPAAISLRSPSGLAPRDGGDHPEPKGATTLTTTSTETN